MKFDQIRFKKLGAMPGQNDRGYRGQGVNDGGGVGKNKRPVKEIVTSGGYRVPENLFAKEEDTEEQREIKKRKLQGIKKAQKGEAQEVQSINKANDWKRFLIKNSGASRGVKTGSIFSSNEQKNYGSAINPANKPRNIGTLR